MAARFITTQVDFSGGQIDEDAKRREDNKAAKTGGRAMSNWRARNVGTLDVRPGRNAIALAAGPRAERFRMSPTQELIITFSTGALAITDTAGNAVASNASASYIWTNATVSKINWCVTPDRVVICFPGMPPQIILWDSGANTFAFSAFAFAPIAHQVQEPFFRFAADVSTIYPSAIYGTITLTCSIPFFKNSMIGEYLSIAGQQVHITAVGSVTPITTATGVVSNSLALSYEYTNLPSGVPAQDFPLHTLAETSVSKIMYEVTYNTGTTLIGTIVNGINIPINSGDWLVSAWGQMSLQPGQGAQYVGPQAVVTWQQEFMNAGNGWPCACFYAHQRLGFCDFPRRPDAIIWSAPGSYTIFWVDSAAAIGNPNAGANPNCALFEFISAGAEGGVPHVRNVIEWNGDEFIFTDRGINVLPVANQAGGLQPGTVRFTFISDRSASTLAPAVTRDALIFTSASGDRVSAIIRTGNFTTPYAEQDLTQFPSQLIDNPLAITVGKGDDGFPERYIYVLNSDGSIAVGRAQEDKSFVGWMPWTGAGLVSWISQGYLTVLLTTLYGTKYILEYENSGYYLDQAVLVNSPPAKMLTGGHGAFIAFASGTVRVMDGAIDHGTRAVDATGHLIALPADDFSSATLVAGQAFTSTLSPFVPEAQPGLAMGQRQRQRRISRAAVQVYNSNGFTFGDRTIPPNNFGEDPTIQPVLRETTYRTRQLGRSFDPQIVLLKDNPGPLTVVEFAIESTV